MILCKRLKDGAVTPIRASVNDAGWHFYLPEDATIPTHGRKIMLIMPMGIAVTIPDWHFRKIETRSSLAKHGIETWGGVIGEGYRVAQNDSARTDGGRFRAACVR